MPSLDRRQIAALLICAGISFGMIYEAAQLYFAWDWGESSAFAAQVRGAKLIPGNAEAWDRLGRAVESNFDQFDPRQALAYFKRSVAVDPHSAQYWLDLAAAYELNGNRSQAQAAYESALRVYPISAEVAWQYGNFLLRQNDAEDGLLQIRSAVATDADLIPLALSRMWSFNPDIQFVARILPPGRFGILQAINYFSREHQVSAALEMWERLLAVGPGHPLPLDSIFPLEDELIAEERAQDALRIWHEALRAANWPEAPPSGDSLVWNGGFEVKPANGGLGWRVKQVPGAYISFDENEKYSGKRSLRADFTGGMNLDFAAVSQFVPVEPDQTYTLGGYLRTEDISTESGMRLEAEDTATGKRVETEQVTGSHEWAFFSCTFQTGPKTHFVEIRLRRFPSRLFNNQLSGTVWLDDISLVPGNSATASGGDAQ